VLGGVGGVGQRPEQERAVSEAVAEPALERLEVRRRRGQPKYLRKASVALVPPNPNALDSAYSTSTLRAWLGM
jgi:hypothetical protein